MHRVCGAFVPPGQRAAAGGGEAGQGILAQGSWRLCENLPAQAGAGARNLPCGGRHQFYVNRGESVGLVGESGCGKSTTSTMVMRLIDKSDGVIMFDGEDIGAIAAKAFAKLPLRRRIQMVFQDPTDSLNPRFTAARAIADPILRLGDVKGRAAVRARCETLARQVGLPVELLDRFPHQLSGGGLGRAPMDTAWAQASEIAAAVCDGRTSAVAVVRAALARIAKHDRVLNAFTAVTAERALAKAAALDAERARGRRLGGPPGAPFAGKNLFDITGLPTRAGSK